MVTGTPVPSPRKKKQDHSNNVPNTNQYIIKFTWTLTTPLRPLYPPFWAITTTRKSTLRPPLWEKPNQPLIQDIKPLSLIRPTHCTTSTLGRRFCGNPPHFYKLPTLGRSACTPAARLSRPYRTPSAPTRLHRSPAPLRAASHRVPRGSNGKWGRAGTARAAPPFLKRPRGGETSSSLW